MGDFNAVKKRQCRLTGGTPGGWEGHAEAVQVTDHIGHSYLGQLCNFADILPTYVKVLNVTVRATGTIGTGFGILRGTLPDTKRQRGTSVLNCDLRHHFSRHEKARWLQAGGY